MGTKRHPIQCGISIKQQLHNVVVFSLSNNHRMWYFHKTSIIQCSTLTKQQHYDVE